MVGDGDIWRPTQLVGVCRDVFSWVSGTGQVRVKDGAAGVEPFNGPVRSLPELVEVVVALGTDGAVLPFVVDGFDVVRPAVASRRADDHFDPEIETHHGPHRERDVLVGCLYERVID